MKRKRSKARKWLLRLSFFLLGSPFMVFYLGLTILILLVQYEDATFTPEGSLNGHYADYMEGWPPRNRPGDNVPAYAILQDQIIEAPPGRLYTFGWHNSEAAPCLAVSLVQGAGDFYRTLWGRYAKAHCSANAYSIDWYLEAGGWDGPPFAVVYGFSGDAETVEATWDDGAVTLGSARRGSYALVLERRAQTIVRVAFLDEDGRMAHSFSPRMRLGQLLCDLNGRTVECES